ncbi:Multicopper like protein [Coniochaeta hoffmannii]|uniref:Multicopper like protein n=2 Tax=Coniochaeta hoffmannii TaxID=91930 RepID=A0AA38VII9_9PEZI|nr:Multicopper like protein [Coniochaeta hoffmannii]
MASTCLRRLLLPLALLLSSISLSLAATVTYDFDIGWVTANPDGKADRPVIGINGQWPLPLIEVDVGDRLVVNVLNSLGNQTTSLHFHGLFMNGSTHMDGPVQISQCAIAPGSRFTYDFVVNQPGTYWYHSHSKGQYPDGIRGPFIVHDPENPYKDQYDEEVVISVSDWYHDQMPGLIDFFMSKKNPGGAEPVPQSALFNDTQDLQVAFQPGKTYFVRMVNIGAFAGQYVWFEGHNMTIVEVDGVYTHPAEASLIYLSAAQRCSFLLTAKNETDANFPFVASMDTSLFDSFPEDLDYNVTGWLVYDSAKPLPDPALLDEFDVFDDITLRPFDDEPIFGEPDQTVTLSVIMDNLNDGGNYAFFDNITYTAAKVPTLYTALSSGDLATDPRVYGEYTHPFVLEKDQIVDIVVNNIDPGRHPFHLHGHNFQVLWRSEEEAGTFEESNVTSADFPAVPMRRDTFVLYPDGNIVLRFKADNPGVWLFHCHIEWHVVSGLAATFVEAPLELQSQLKDKIPQDHLDACADLSVPTTGNAAGNTVDLLDLKGQPEPPKPLPKGFTARGIVALVFSIISGLLGVGTIIWYGLAGDEGRPGFRAAVVAAEGGREGEKGAGEAVTAVPDGEVAEPEGVVRRSGEGIGPVSGGGGRL